MRVIIEAPLLVSARAKADPLALLALFHLCMDQECHCIEVEPDDSPEFQAWMQTLTPELREQVTFLLGESAKRQARDTPARSIRVADIPQPDWSPLIPRLSLQAAVMLMKQPLRVLIEGVHDEAFLLSVVPLTHRARFEDWLKQDILKMEYRGGLDSLHHALEKDCREPSRRLRLFAMFDSDARKRGEPSRPSKELKRLCQRMSVTHHQLQRRAIENYIPKPALERWLKDARSRDFGDWLLKLRALYHPQVTDEQRHHYPMKKGLLGDQEGDGVSAIYTGLDPAIAAELQNGFGGDIARAFQKSTPTAWLIDDGQMPELVELFTNIFRAA